MMSTHSQIVSPLPARHDQQHNGVSRVRSDREGGSGSESSDWTGTGEDWTGASSDSAFINYIRSHQHGGSNSFSPPGVTPSPPPPRSNSQGDLIYTHLNPLTINQDNQYASIDRLHPIAGKSQTLSPSPNRRATPITTSLNSVCEQTEDDEYCKMVPNMGIRASLLRKTPMSVPAQHLPLPPLPGENAIHPALSSPLPAHRKAPQHSNSLGEMYTPRE